MNHRIYFPRPRTPYKPQKQPNLAAHIPKVVDRDLLTRMKRIRQVHLRGQMVCLDALNCHRKDCGLTFKIGDILLRSGRYYYHAKCYDSMYMDCEEPTEEEMKDLTVVDGE